MKTTIIKLSNVGKRYELHHEKPTLVENILLKHKKEPFWALRNINLEVKRGERIGIIGPNGAGKTTLLEILSGITTPTEGQVSVLGKTVSLIELEAGFHPDLTGEENLYLNGLLLGMTKQEILSKKKSILDFSGLGSFIDTPLYTYSSGMKLRLGFSIAVHADPKILILDENMSVGDKDFRAKSYKKIVSFIKQKVTIVMASHHIPTLKTICNRTIHLDHGQIIKTGGKEVFNEYSSADE